MPKWTSSFRPRLFRPRVGISACAVTLTLVAAFFWPQHAEPLSVDEQKLVGVWHTPTSEGFGTIEFLPDRNVHFQSDGLQGYTDWRLNDGCVVVSKTVIQHTTPENLADIAACLKRLTRWPPRNPLCWTWRTTCKYQPLWLNESVAALRLRFTHVPNTSSIGDLFYYRTKKEANASTPARPPHREIIIRRELEELEWDLFLED